MNPPTLFSLPSDYARIRVVGSFEELVATRFGDGVNALCWPRTLAGDFDEVAAAIGKDEEIVTLDEPTLRALALSESGRAAAEVLIADLRLLQERGLAPVLNCIHHYPRDEDGGPVPTDVYSYHVDSAPVEADTYLCTYAGPASEGLRNEEARRRADVPETRAELLKLFGGGDDAGFREFLSENCYDRHYASAAGARPYSFGLGNLWRIACEYPGSPVPPCVHRAPEHGAASAPRLLLIS